jgi:hypothetical protein
LEELQLTQSQADEMTKWIKHFLKRYSAVLFENASGKIQLQAANGHTFQLCYLFADGNNHLQFMDLRTKLTLARVNLNDSFHKNADGSIIRGNRINVFSADEYYAKADGITHTRCFALPYAGIQDSDDFFQVLHDLLDYERVSNPSQLNLRVDIPLLP